MSHLSPFNVKIPQLPPFKTWGHELLEHSEANFASQFYKQLAKWITEFDQSLDPAHEVGVRLVSFGQTVVFHLESMGYSDPSLISFSGRTDSDEPVHLIQHVSQISILLMKLPRKNPSEPKTPLGFHAILEDQKNEPEMEQ